MKIIRNKTIREMKKWFKENLSTIVEVLSLLVSLIGLYIQ